MMKTSVIIASKDKRKEECKLMSNITLGEFTTKSKARELISTKGSRTNCDDSSKKSNVFSETLATRQYTSTHISNGNRFQRGRRSKRCFTESYSKALRDSLQLSIHCNKRFISEPTASKPTCKYSIVSYSLNASNRKFVLKALIAA
eukprot:TRINITY_DN4032_c0_g1_i5.p2 TRINITY_DN4032_c0_g1~~TRINITY_DN4032_c0_g1_i5.p2  ORF type:complete len:146 (+),score=13.27 TRINITY_DN4032_c0_g1_i5:409-846(+)